MPNIKQLISQQSVSPKVNSKSQFVISKTGEAKAREEKQKNVWEKEEIHNHT